MFDFGAADSGVRAAQSSLKGQRNTTKGSGGLPPESICGMSQFSFVLGWSAGGNNYIQIQVSTLGYQSIELKYTDYEASSDPNRKGPSLRLRGSADGAFTNPTVLVPEYRMTQWTWITRAATVRNRHMHPHVQRYARTQHRAKCAWHTCCRPGAGRRTPLPPAFQRHPWHTAVCVPHGQCLPSTTGCWGARRAPRVTGAPAGRGGRLPGD